MDANNFKNKILRYDFNNEDDIISFVRDVNEFFSSDYFNNLSIFTLIEVVNIFMNTSFNLFSNVANQKFRNISSNRNFLFYDASLEQLSKRLIAIQKSVNKYYHVSLLDNQATRTLLLFYKARVCADKTFMSLSRYGRDGIILKMDENQNALDENGIIINDDDLSACLDNLTINNPTLRKPALLASNLESKSKVINSYFGFAGVIGDNAIISLQRENRQNNIQDDTIDEDDEIAEDFEFNEEVSQDEEIRTNRANAGYNVDEYDAFMLSMINRDDPLTSQIFLTIDPLFCNKLNQLTDNEIEIRQFFRRVDDKYKVYRRIKGFNFSGFKTGLWIGYPNCKFYYKDENDQWYGTITQNNPRSLKRILLRNYESLTSSSLKQEIRKKYIAHFKNLNNIWETRLASLRSIQNTGRWNNRIRSANLIPTDAELNALELEWNRILKRRMRIISEDFTIFTENDYNSFFNNNVDTTISVIKLKRRQ